MLNNNPNSTHENIATKENSPILTEKNLEEINKEIDNLEKEINGDTETLSYKIKEIDALIKHLGDKQVPDDLLTLVKALNRELNDLKADGVVDIQSYDETKESLEIETYLLHNAMPGVSYTTQTGIRGPGYIGIVYKGRVLENIKIRDKDNKINTKEIDNVIKECALTSDGEDYNKFIEDFDNANFDYNRLFGDMYKKLITHYEDIWRDGSNEGFAKMKKIIKAYAKESGIDLPDKISLNVAKDQPTIMVLGLNDELLMGISGDNRKKNGLEFKGTNISHSERDSINNMLLDLHGIEKEYNKISKSREKTKQTDKYKSIEDKSEILWGGKDGVDLLYEISYEISDAKNELNKNKNSKFKKEIEYSIKNLVSLYNRSEFSRTKELLANKKQNGEDNIIERTDKIIEEIENKLN